jgi:hypothetical protein
MKNISFIVEVYNTTTKLQETLEELKKVVIIGDEVIMHIDPVNLTDENLEIVNEWESITKRYNKFTNNIIVDFIKVFSPEDVDVENKTTKSIIYYIQSKINKNEINLLRNEN